MPAIEWKVDENIAVLTMKAGENRFNVAFCEEMLAALDEIEQKTKVSALVVTATHEKIWSNGMDLDWLIPAWGRQDPEVEKFLRLQDKMMKRLLFYPMITVASITGHAFASGAIFACCFDFRFMRNDRGFLCFPEVDINIPFLHYMDALIKKALPKHMQVEAEMLGKRFTAQELEQFHVIRKACSLDELLKESTAFAKSLNKGRWIVGEMKKVMYKDIGYMMDNVVRPNLNPGDIPIK